MFKFFKEKLKQAISRASEKIEEEGATIEEEAPIEQPDEKKGFLAKIKERFAKKEERKEIREEAKEQEAESQEKQKKILEKQEEQILEKEKEIIKEEQEIEKKSEEKEKAETELEKEAEAETELEKEAEDALKEEEEKRLEAERIEKEAKLEELEERKRGIFSKIKEKIVTKKISYNQFEDIFYDLELILLQNNVAVEVIDKIKSDLKNQIVEKPIRRNKIEETIKRSLKSSITDLFDVEDIDVVRMIKRKIEKPFVIAFLGVNGSGKTTTISKIADLLKRNNISCVLAASDTFRAASIEQLQKHADNLGLKLIKHDYGSDPAAVAFDAIAHAKAKNIDAVLIDTAGRMHSNANLMEEMKKIVNVAKPDLKIFVGEAITGNDCTEQAKIFNEAVGIDGIILAKADIDEKGGAAISVSYVTKKPIIYLGVGQNYADLKPFNPSVVVEGLGLDA
jgi:fused signal recognition particle receptor